MIAWILLVLALIGLAASILYGRRKFRGNTMWRRVIVVWGVVTMTILVAILPIGLSGRSTTVSNRDVILVVDLTQSVNAVDSRAGGEATRIDDIKTDMRRIAEEQVGASIGIMTFSDRTDLYLPLTTGSADVNTAIDTLYTASSNQSISKIVRYQDVFKSVSEYLAAQRQTDPTRERVVVFMSDFEIFKEQESRDDIVNAASAIANEGAAYVGLAYGSGQPAQMLSVGFNYLSGNFEPTYITYPTEGDVNKYLQDNYKPVFSTANPELSGQIAQRIGGQSIKPTDSEQFAPILEKAAGKSSSATSRDTQTQARKQQIFYVFPALFGFTWLVMIELIRPSWAMKRFAAGLRASRSKDDSP